MSMEIVQTPNRLSEGSILDGSNKSATVRKKRVDSQLSATTLYPNPADNVIYVKSRKEDQPLEICVLDIWGRVVIPPHTPKGHLEEIDISKLSSGCYFVDIKYMDYNERYKIIKK